MASTATDEVVVVSPNQFTFTSTTNQTVANAVSGWNVAQMVTIQGVNDGLQDGSQSISISITVVDAESDDAYDSAADRFVTVINRDNDSVNLDYPSNGETIIDTLPRIQWTRVEEATSYAYWLSDRTRRISGVYRNFGYWPITEFVPRDVLLPGSYRLEVRAQRPTVGSWTVVNFTIGETSSPVITDPVGPTAFPTIAWTPVIGAATYDLSVTDTSNNPIRAENGLTRPGYASRFDPGTYRAIVQAKDADGANVGSASPMFEFTVVANVAVTNDIENEITDATPLFEWSEVPGAAFYELWADNRTTQTIKAAWDNRLFGTEFPQRQPLDDHQFQWQIKATGWNGFRGAWTPVKRFTVNIPSPASPVISSPVANSTTTDTTPTINWNDVQFATIYDLWVDNRTTGQLQIIRESKLVDSTFTPENPLPIGEYSIEVRAANEQRTTYGSNISHWSTRILFNITGAVQSSRAASTAAATETARNSAPDHVANQPLILASSVANSSHSGTSVNDWLAGQAATERSNNSGIVNSAESLAFGDYRVWLHALNNSGNLKTWTGSGDSTKSVIPFGIASDEFAELLILLRKSQITIRPINGLQRFSRHNNFEPTDHESKAKVRRNLEVLSNAELNALDAVYVNYE